jgi:hypothetical protein
MDQCILCFPCEHHKMLFDTGVPLHGCLCGDREIQNKPVNDEMQSCLCG